MPECTSTGCRRERLSRFFAIGAVRRLRGVAVDCLTHLGIHNSAAQLMRVWPARLSTALLHGTPRGHPGHILSSWLVCAFCRQMWH